MRLPGFAAEAALMPSVYKYRRLNSVNMASVPVITPQTTWQNCSTDGRLCYICSDDSGTCICNWFYDGQWYATTDCGSGFGSSLRRSTPRR